MTRQEPIDTFDFLCGLGWREADEGSLASLAFDFETGVVEAMRTVGRNYGQVVLLTGVLSDGRRISMIESELPVTLPSWEVGMAALGHILHRRPVGETAPKWVEVAITLRSSLRGNR